MEGEFCVFARGKNIISAKVKCFAALYMAVAASFLGGCGTTVKVTPEGGHNLALMHPRRAAVLKVTARPVGELKVSGPAWGVLECVNAEERFAELLAHAAAQHAGLPMVPHDELTARIEQVGGESAPNPDSQQIAERASALGCSVYLTAHVQRWRCSYVLFLNRTRIEFDVAICVPEQNEAVWKAHVQCSSSRLDETEIALYALKEALAPLRGNF